MIRLMANAGLRKLSYSTGASGEKSRKVATLLMTERASRRKAVPFKEV